MKLNRLYFLIFGVVLLLGFVSASGYLVSNPSLTYGRTQSAFVTEETNMFNSEMCQEGQDFVLQIDPLGCEPAIVRSDLLEDQEVPVFCKINALKINPLIDVNSINSMKFRGDYGSEVRTVGFYPSRAALGKSDQLNNMNSQGIGYAVIMLRAQPNESAMPDFVSGNLTATLKYDLRNAFGIRDSSFYLSVLDEKDWENRMVQYSFWQGKGYVRAEDVTENRATIAVYSDRYQTSFGGGNAGSNSKHKIGSFTLGVGDSTNKLFLPGFDCIAGLQLKLNSIENPDTFARLKINSDYLEVKKNEWFLDNKCKVTSINKEGLTQEVGIYCNQDSTIDYDTNFNLAIAPRVELSINDQIGDYSVGDYLYEARDPTFQNEIKYVYLGYIDSESGFADADDMYVYLVAIPNKLEGKYGETDLDDATLKSVSDYAKSMRNKFGNDNFGRQFKDLLVKGTREAVKVGEDFGVGKTIYLVSKKEGVDEFLGENIQVRDFAGGSNREYDNQTFSEYYSLAKKDYLAVKESFSIERYPDSDEFFTGEKALYKLIEMASDTYQNEDVLIFCKEFDEVYPESGYMFGERKQMCEDKFFSSSIGINNADLLIDNNYYDLSFEGISEPSIDDFGIEIIVDGPNGEHREVPLRKDQVFYLDDFRDNDKKVFTKTLMKKDSTARINYYFSYVGGSWKWRSLNDGSNWMDLDKKGVVSLIDSSQEAANFAIGLKKLNSYEEGVQFITSAGGDYNQVREYIRLLDLKPESAYLDINLEYSGEYGAATKAITSISETLEKDKPFLKSGYTFTLNKINLKQNAKVSLVSTVNYDSSEANFSFNIGIDKRLIQLSPEKAAKKVENLNKTIHTMEKISKTLGTVVDIFDKSCQYTGIALTLKNLVKNAGGRSIARKEVMTEVGGWNDYSENYDNLGEGYVSFEDCLFENAPEIDAEVEKFYQIMEGQNTRAKEIEGMEGVLVDSRGLFEKQVNTDKQMEIYSKDVLGELGEVRNKDGEVITKEKLNEILTYNPDGTNYYSLSQLKEIELYNELLKDSSLNSERRESYEERLFSAVNKINVNAKNYLERESLAKSLGVENSNIGFLPIGGDLKEIPYEGLVAKDLDLSWVSKTFEKDDRAVQILSASNGKTYVVQLNNIGRDELTISRDLVEVEGKMVEKLIIYDLEGKFLVNPPEEFNKIYFKKYDEKNYKNGYKVEPKVRYYETEPYKGLPAIVPFDEEEGWYAFVEQKISSGRQMEGYYSSGAVSSFWVCNIGDNQLEDGGPGKGDDVCRLINKGTGQLYNQFPGLESNKASTIISKAEAAIVSASKGYKEGQGRVSVGEGKSMQVGSPLVSGESGLACTDFMSPKDCKLLFNVCDPVVCPRDRCDYGGAYPVKDVIQSGIIGSVALCLPNAKEGIKVPVCLSGVEAGVDSLTSVFKSYQSCLQENIETGRTVGICDEIHSIYLCEFLWKQALPLGKIIVPKLASLALGQNVRGGGSYSGFDAAWKNAKDSVTFFTDFYAANSFNALKARSTEEVGGAVCKNFISAVYPNKFGNLGDLSLSYSPTQFNARFEEIPFTTVTNPPVSQYKVYFHIYSGKDRGAYYRVWLRGDEGSNFFQGTGGRIVDSDYIPAGESADKTLDFTAPSGFKELCVNVNGQEECGFGQVTTGFGATWLKDQYVASQLTDFDVSSEEECISGSREWYTLLNPNIQSGIENTIDPAIYNDAIIRTCATGNPGSDVLNGQRENPRWVEVGNCGDENIKCYLDTQSVDRAAEFETTKEGVSEKIGKEFADKLNADVLSDDDFSNKLDDIKKAEEKDKVGLIKSLLNKVYTNNQKAHLLFLEGNVYAGLTKLVYDDIVLQREIKQCNDWVTELGLNKEDYDCEVKENRTEVNRIYQERAEIEDCESKKREIGLEGYNCEDQDIRDEINNLYRTILEIKACEGKKTELGLNPEDYDCTTEGGRKEISEKWDDQSEIEDCKKKRIILGLLAEDYSCEDSEVRKEINEKYEIIGGSTGDLSCGGEILSVALGKIGSDTVRFNGAGEEVYDNVCATFVSRVLIQAGALPEITVCDEPVPYVSAVKDLVELFRSSDYENIKKEDWAKGLEKGDVLVWGCDGIDGCKNGKNDLQHITIFKKYDEINGVEIVHDAGKEDTERNRKNKVENKTYPNIFGSSWYVTQVWRADECGKGDGICNNNGTCDAGETITNCPQDCEEEKTLLNMDVSPLFRIDSTFFPSRYPYYKFFEGKWHWSPYKEADTGGVVKGASSSFSSVSVGTKEVSWLATTTYDNPYSTDDQPTKDSRFVIRDLGEFSSYLEGLNYLIEKSVELNKDLTSFGTTMDEKKRFEVIGFEEVEEVYFSYSDSEKKWGWSYDKLGIGNKNWRKLNEFVKKNRDDVLRENEKKLLVGLEGLNFFEGASYLFNLNLVNFEAGEAFEDAEAFDSIQSALEAVRELRSYERKFDYSVSTRRFFEKVKKGNNLLTDAQILDISGDGSTLYSDLINARENVGDIANYLVDNERRKNKNKYSLLGALVKAEVIESGSYYKNQQFIEDLRRQGGILDEETYKTITGEKKDKGAITSLIEYLKNKLEGDEVSLHKNDLDTLKAFVLANNLNLEDEIGTIIIEDNHIIEYRVNDKGISNINYLSKLMNLKILTLDDNNIEDLTPLKELSSLETLSLADNNIEDLTPLKELSNLKFLNLYGNNIEDLTPLKELSNLNALYLGDNNIEDLTPLKKLSNLDFLAVPGNPLSSSTDIEYFERTTGSFSYHD